MKGRRVRAAEMLGLSLNHPATNSEIKQAAQPALVTLHDTLSAAEVEAALGRGKTLNWRGLLIELVQKA